MKKKKKKQELDKNSQPLFKTLLMQHLQPEVVLNMMPQAWSTLTVSTIPLCIASQAPLG